MRYILKVCSKALPGRHDDYEAWYANTHLPEVLAMVPGYLACTRYISAGADKNEPPQFTAFYEVEARDPGTVLRVLRETGPRFNQTDSLDRDSVTTEVLIPHDERLGVSHARG